MSKKQQAVFEGYADAEKLKAWFDELLKTIQSAANTEQKATTVKLTIKITARPQPNEEQEPDGKRNNDDRD